MNDLDPYVATRAAARYSSEVIRCLEIGRLPLMSYNHGQQGMRNAIEMHWAQATS